MNAPLVSPAPGNGTARRLASPGVGAPRPLQPSFSRLPSPWTQGPLSPGEPVRLPRPLEGGGLEKSLYETSLLAEAKPRRPSG